MVSATIEIVILAGFQLVQIESTSSAAPQIFANGEHQLVQRRAYLQPLSEVVYNSGLVLQAHGDWLPLLRQPIHTPRIIVAVQLVMMAPDEDQGFESMLAQLDARGCRRRAPIQRQSPASTAGER